MELSKQPLAVKMLYNSGSMWPSVVVHEHWPVSQRIMDMRFVFIFVPLFLYFVFVLLFYSENSSYIGTSYS
jgi:hypothetical protein